MLHTLLSSCVLIIDNADFSRDVATRILKSQNIDNILHAKNGKDGLEMTKIHKPDLIISDLIMSEMDGFAYCRAVRQMKEFRDTPIIIQTSLDEPEKRAEAFVAGATDVLSKPLNPSEMIARTKIHLEKQELLTNLRGYHKRVKAELANARNMQHEVLPSKKELAKICTDFPISMHTHFESSSELSGDFWGIEQLSENELAFYMIDFTGHGVKAAINTFRLHALMHSEFTPTNNAGEYLTKLNTRLHSLLAVESFATMFYGVINFDKQLLNFATAASPSPLLFSADDNEIHELDGSGLPLSAMKDTIYETKTIDFNKGDTLLCYSDALIEFTNEDGSMSSEDYFYTYCEGYAHIQRRLGNHINSLSLLQETLSYMKNATGDAPVEDDLTILSLTHLRA